MPKNNIVSLRKTGNCFKKNLFTSRNRNSRGATHSSTSKLNSTNNNTEPSTHLHREMVHKAEPPSGVLQEYI